MSSIGAHLVRQHGRPEVSNIFTAILEALAPL